ncbi:MAG: hypothetical protein ACREAK_05075 [Nitrosarchaeum sp.]
MNLRYKILIVSFVVGILILSVFVVMYPPEKNYRQNYDYAEPKVSTEELLLDLGEEGEFYLKYWLKGAKLQSITKDPLMESLNVELTDSKNDGYFEITIPRNLLDAKIGDSDDTFVVIADKYEVPYTEITNDFERTVRVEFNEGTKLIKIIATLPLSSESELKFEPPDTNSELGTPPLQIKVVGENQVRRGTTHSIEIQVVRGSSPIEGARVFIDIEDYGEDIIKEFDGYTDSQGYFVFSWEIPQTFDDVETLLAFIDVTDGISSKTELFKFQVYCLPGEKNCKAKGN